MSTLRVSDILQMLEQTRLDSLSAPRASSRTRDRIVAAAAELFSELGYRRTSLDEVARRAAVAKGTIYVHFSSKADLLMHAVSQEKRRYLAEMEPIFRAEHAPKERLAAYLALVFRMVTEMPLVARLTSGDGEIDVIMADVDPEVRAGMEAMQVAFLAALLQEIPRPGGWPEALLEERARALLAVAYASSSLIHAHKRAGMSAAKLAEVLAQILVGGIAA